MLLQLKFEIFLYNYTPTSHHFLAFPFYFVKQYYTTCRFLQGPDTDQAVVQDIRDAIREHREVTVQLINYSKSGKLSCLRFWRACRPRNLCYYLCHSVISNWCCREKVLESISFAAYAWSKGSSMINILVFPYKIFKGIWSITIRF